MAALLHDVGRYAVDQALIFDRVPGEGPPPPRSGARPRGHHEVGAELIAPWVPERVAWCVRAHADAKRYLCSVEPGYYDVLSPASKRTLELQGGVMTTGEAAQLAAHPWVADVVALRRWDDRAKVVGKATRPLSAWASLLRRYFRDAASPTT